MRRRSLWKGGGSEMFLNPDHVTIAGADAGPAIEFFALLGFRKEHVATIDGGLPARYMGMPRMKAQRITLALVQWGDSDASDRSLAASRLSCASHDPLPQNTFDRAILRPSPNW